jgi:valyl-tRNA synthetase
MSKLPDRYNTQETEKKQQKFWAQNQVYKWQNDLPKNQTFVIDTPPPTVSGLLHMGHIFSYTQADFVARYKRMKGLDVFYPMGFDDNGLPTERLVEKTIGKKAGVYEAENGRGSFVKECQKVVDVAEVEFENLFNTIALSVDWDQKYQTISKESQQLSQASFVDLFNKNLVERRFAPVLWDCVDRTALSQADLVDKEMPSAMHDIVFEVENKDWIATPSARNDGADNSEQNLSNRHCEDGQRPDAAIQNADSNKIIIATTRPELLPACVAVMVHPEDERYKNLHGKNAITALFGVKVPIITDELVQMEKGTGAVMCCIFGDETDIKWWQKYEKIHSLPIPCIITKNGTMSKCIVGQDVGESNNDLIFTGNTPGDTRIGTWCHHSNLHDFVNLYKNLVEGKKIKEARESIIEALKNPSQNLLIKSNPITHSVKCAERSGTPIEILVGNQWFVKILDKKDQLKQKANECNWYPDYMKIRVEQWIDNLAWDWCISRQRYFGVPFPIWYSKRKGEEGKILVASFDQLPIDPQRDLPKGYSADEVQAETDIMDTWATSSISPQLSSKGISAEFMIDKQRHEKLFPADLRPQAHEIIRTWAFYTIAKAMLHEDKIPWKNLMISGWCLAADKTKMSKSKGNVVTPQSLIEEKGADVVRYWASASNLGADIAYSEELFKIGGKLITKLFNASKFVAQNFADLTLQPTNPKEDIAKNIINEKSDLWILSRLNQTILKAEQEFEQFEYAKARQAVEDFFWNDFCDNYLEIVKVRSYGLNAEKYKEINLSEEQKAQIIYGQQSGLFALYHCLEALLKLFSPFVPHITEELYQAIFPNKLTSIHQRGSWCKLEDYILDKEALEIGEIMKEVIFNIRKFKSDNNLSMKTPIQKFSINTKINISAVISDLQNVCNTAEILTKNDDGKSLVFDIT